MELMAMLSNLLSFLDVLQNFLSFRSYIHFFPISVQKFVLDIAQTKSTPTEAIEECCSKELTSEEICIDDVNVVMQRLGIACKENHDHHHQAANVTIDVKEFAEIFVDEQPSSSEIKQVFEVFDANGDGFIDAIELQRVMQGLCMKEGFKLEQCRKMICAYDANGDGLLDFEEFIIVMEKCFS